MRGTEPDRSHADGGSMRMGARSAGALALALGIGLGCNGSGSGSGSGDGDQGGGGGVTSIEGVISEVAALAAAFGGRSFERPVKLVQHPGDDDRWYVVEQRGDIRTFLESDLSLTTDLAVAVTDYVTLGTGNEQGLLGMAFDPDFGVSTDDIFLSYTEDDPGGFISVLARYESMDGGLTLAPAAGGPIVHEVGQPDTNHNGGDLAFRASDAMLYWGLGDGGGSGDPGNNGQDVTTPLGAILRLDPTVDPPIPIDNPFVGSPGNGLIWAYGLRNPWRFSFDATTDTMWVGDVGENSREEIDRIEKSGNYGWNCREGNVDFEIDADCSPPYVEPETTHDRNTARSITGGYVYRGAAIPELSGAYVYGDFVTGRVFAWYFEENPPRLMELDLGAPSVSVASFGVDRDAELYILDLDFGAPSQIYKIVPAP